jgi:hypothetical protein
MNTKINLWKDKELLVKLSGSEITQERILKQTRKCEEVYDEWDFCVKKRGWNDENCIGQMKPKYEYCIQKKNLMQTIYDNRIDESK